MLVPYSTGGVFGGNVVCVLPPLPSEVSEWPETSQSSKHLSPRSWVFVEASPFSGFRSVYPSAGS